MEKTVAEVVRRLRPSAIREMSLRAAGLDNVISLGIGEPDFHTPEEICQRAFQDAMRGATHYTPSQGDPELLAALQGYLNGRFGHDLSVDEMLITMGGMGALTAYFRTVLNPGDEVLVPEPHFPSYRPQIEWAGGKVVHVPTSFQHGFVLDAAAVERSMTPRTRVLLLNSPNNPTGAVLAARTLDDLASLAQRRDLLVVSDEVYDRLLFDGLQHDSIFARPGMRERTVVVGSFSKAFAMTGWRIGYAFGPAWLMKEMTKVVMFYTSCASSVSQRAALAALKQDPSVVEAMVEEFRLRRDLVYDALSRMPGVKVHSPAGSFYIFPSITTVARDAEQFALDFLEEERVVVIPGVAFGPSGQGCVRIAFTVERGLLAEAIGRLARFVEKKTVKNL
jgi:aminotransferase